MAMIKKAQEPLREMGALAALRASMDQAAGNGASTPVVVAPAEPLDVIAPEGNTPALTPEEKAAARRARDAERKRLKREAEKLKIEEGGKIIDDAAAEMERTGAEIVQIPVKAKPISEAEAVIEQPQISDEQPVADDINDDDVDAALDAHVTRAENAATEELAEQVGAEVAEEPAAIEPSITEAETAPVEQPKQPLDKDQQEKAATITRIVSFFPEKFREEEASMLRGFDVRRLQEIGATLTRHLGEPDGHASELHKVYLERMKDPAVIAALNAMDRLGGDYDKLISRIARAVGDDVLTNALTGNDFRTAARDAVNTLAVLKKMIIGDLEPVLSRYLNPTMTVKRHDPDLPEGLGQLMGVLKHAAAHLDAAVSRNKANETQKEELLARIVQANRHAEIANERASAAERKVVEQFVPIPETEVFVYCRTTKKFLANHMLPTGRNPEKKKVSIIQFYWTSNPAEALRFPDRERALRAVDAMMEGSIKLTPKLDPNVAGENIANVGIADAVIRLPTE